MHMPLVAGRGIECKKSCAFPLPLNKLRGPSLLLLEGSSVLLLARTGWGKSLIFQGLRYAALKESDRPQSRHITVVFVPLSGLGQEQVDEINEKAGSNVAIFYDKTKVHDRHLLDIRNGRYSWLFISPEKALH